MFVYQAFEAFKIWHGIEPQINDETLEILKMIRIGILGDIGSEKVMLPIILDIQYLMQIMKYQNFIKKTKKSLKN